MAIVLRITLDGGHKFLDITKSKHPLVFGRSDDCDYPIKNEGCSGSHLEITLKATGISIKDLDSKNGTILNNSKMSKDKLYVDDIIQIGDIFIELHTESLTTIEKERFKNIRPDFDKGSNDLTIPDMAKSQKRKEKLVSDDKKRHGFNELTNITEVEKKISLVKINKTKKK